jgi:hypothetical protein
MVIKKTPFRLIKTANGSYEDRDAPIVEMDGNEAITRRVPNPFPNSETIPATPPPSLVRGGAPSPVQTALAPPHRPDSDAAASMIAKKTTFALAKAWLPLSMKSLVIPGIAIAVVAAIVLTILLLKPAPSSVSMPVSPTPPAIAIPVAGAEPARIVPETIRLQVTATPREATVSLDGNLVAGYLLNLIVPRDRGIHVISASAPGYIPFNQQVGFDSDVVLSITLRRDSAIPSRPAARTRTQVSEKRTKGEFVHMPAAPATKTSSGSGFEPGMNLEAPAGRANAKSIDERNPYKP